MTERSAGQPIDWYRVPIERATLAELTRKSDWLGGLQTSGFLAILATTGGSAYYSGAHWPWYCTVALLGLHGTCWSFLSNAFHEFCHGTVFATRGLNRFFLAVVSFLSWNNPVLFWTSHTEHHKFTLFEIDDLEVGIYDRPTIFKYLTVAIVNPKGLVGTLWSTFRHSQTRLRGAWENKLFPAAKPELRKRLAAWAWALLIGHGAILGVAIYFKLWMLPVVVSLAPFYGRAIQWLCNEAQHTGLPGNVADYRLCSRTIYLNPVLQFLYWHMNFHIDHHLYAGVPCYRLARLHRIIKADLPACPRGLIATWLEISRILRRQKHEIGYRHLSPVPPMRKQQAARASGGRSSSGG